MTFTKRPHRQICALCHREYAVDFKVSDEIWKVAVHPAYLHALHCLTCFVTRADAQLLPWCDHIEFYPTSLIRHIEQTRQEIAELEAERDRWIDGYNAQKAQRDEFLAERDALREQVEHWKGLAMKWQPASTGTREGAKQQPPPNRLQRGGTAD